MVLITYTPSYLVEEFNSVRLSILLARAHPLVRRFSTQGSNNESDYIAYYLAGLLEGDGHFNTPKKLYAPSGTARVAAIETVFALKDRRSAKLLQSLFGGKIYDHPTKKLTR
jgi:hypothetical protein